MISLDPPCVTFLCKNALQEENLDSSVQKSTLVKSYGPLFFSPNFGTLQNFDAKNQGGTDIMFWHPALAVTSIEWLFQRENHHPRAGWLNRANNKSHKSMRHTFNDRLLCLVTHIPSTPRLRWGLDPLLLLPEREEEGDWRDRDRNLLAMCLSESGSL